MPIFYERQKTTEPSVHFSCGSMPPGPLNWDTIRKMGCKSQKRNYASGMIANTIVTIDVVIADILFAMNSLDDSRSQMSNAEILTVAAQQFQTTGEDGHSATSCSHQRWVGCQNPGSLLAVTFTNSLK